MIPILSKNTKNICCAAYFSGIRGNHHIHNRRRIRLRGHGRSHNRIRCEAYLQVLRRGLSLHDRHSSRFCRQMGG